MPPLDRKLLRKAQEKQDHRNAVMQTDQGFAAGISRAATAIQLRQTSTGPGFLVGIA